MESISSVVVIEVSHTEIDVCGILQPRADYRIILRLPSLNLRNYRERSLSFTDGTYLSSLRIEACRAISRKSMTMVQQAVTSKFHRTKDQSKCLERASQRPISSIKRTILFSHHPPKIYYSSIEYVTFFSSFSSSSWSSYQYCKLEESRGLLVRCLYDYKIFSYLRCCLSLYFVVLTVLFSIVKIKPRRTLQLRSTPIRSLLLFSSPELIHATPSTNSTLSKVSSQPLPISSSITWRKTSHDAFVTMALLQSFGFVQIWCGWTNII